MRAARDRYTGGLTLLIVYGYRVMSNADRLLEMADESLELLSNRIAAAGIVWLVDLFPPRKCSPTMHREVFMRSCVPLFLSKAC